MPLWLLDKRLWAIVGVVVVIVTLIASVTLYGNARYAAGVKDERAVWTEKLHTAVREAREAEREIAAENLRLANEAHQRDLARARALTVVQTEIANAPDFETRYSAYLAHRNSLRNERTERLDRARADYLSTIVAGEPVEP